MCTTATACKCIHTSQWNIWNKSFSKSYQQNLLTALLTIYNKYRPVAERCDEFTLLTSRFIAFHFSSVAAGIRGVKVTINALSCSLWTSISLSKYRMASQLNSLLSGQLHGHCAVKWLVALISLSHAVNWDNHDRCSLVKCFCVWQLGLHLTTFISTLAWKPASVFCRHCTTSAHMHKSDNINIQWLHTQEVKQLMESQWTS